MKISGDTHGENHYLYQDVVLLLILLVALALRIYLANIPTYIWEEAMESIPLSQSISLQKGSLHLPIRGPYHPALSLYFIKLSGAIFGNTPLGFRFLGVLAGLLSIYIAAQLTLEWVGLTAARLVTVLLAFNEYHIAVSALASVKVYYLLFSILAMYFFSRFLRKKDR